MEVRSVRLATRHIHQPVDATKRFDKLGVRHPCTIDLAGLILPAAGAVGEDGGARQAVRRGALAPQHAATSGLASPGCASFRIGI